MGCSRGDRAAARPTAGGGASHGGGRVDRVDRRREPRPGEVAVCRPARPSAGIGREHVCERAGRSRRQDRDRHRHAAVGRYRAGAAAGSRRARVHAARRRCPVLGTTRQPPSLRGGCRRRDHRGPGHDVHRPLSRRRSAEHRRRRGARPRTCGRQRHRGPRGRDAGGPRLAARRSRPAETAAAGRHGRVIVAAARRAWSI
jgi:hypothetical protein